MNNQTETNQPLFDESQLTAFKKPGGLLDSLGNALLVIDVEIEMAEKAYIRHRDSLILRMSQLGKLYTQKKIDLGHGNFANWIKSRELLTQTEVVRCIKVHEVFPDGKISNSATSPNLNRQTILEIIYAPEEVKTAVKELLEAGEDVTRKKVVELKKQAKVNLPAKQEKPLEEKKKADASLGKEAVDDVIEGEYEVVTEQTVPVEPATEHHEDYTELDHQADIITELTERNEYLEGLYVIFEDDDHTAVAIREIAKLKEIIKGLESTKNGLMNENAAMKRRLNSLEKQNKSLLKKQGPVDNSSSDQPPVRLQCEELDIPEWFEDSQDGFNEEIGDFK